MGLVGDIIVNVRRQIPDLCSVMANPSTITATPVNLPTGTLQTPTTVFMVGTIRNQWGETLATPEISQAVAAPNNAIQVTFTNPPFGYSFLRVYYGFASGTWDRFEDIAANPINMTPVGQIAAGQQTVNAGLPPTRNTALLPETDGKWASAASIYGWLQDALEQLMRIAGGITDVTGIQAFNGVISYRAPANFFNYTDAWYDGFVLDCVPRSAIFRRNPVPGIVGYFSVEHDGASSVFSMWPQPSREGSETFLTTQMQPADTVAIINGDDFASNSAGSSPGMGLVQIDNEIMDCSAFGAAQLTGILRGVGGTQAVVHAIGAPVTELNIRLAGKRVLPSVSPGSASLPLDIPPGWDKAAQFYVMALARAAEQDEAASKVKLEEFDAQVKLITQLSKRGTQPRQIQPMGDLPEVYNPNAFGFGRIIN